tara:strand:+ start:107 stop:283 length:177 start_codon:yes stop_codon:yes gene_type:complete
MNPLFAGAIARALLIFLGSRGIALSEDSAGQIVGGLLALGALVWSLRQKQQTIQDERR